MMPLSDDEVTDRMMAVFADSPKWQRREAELRELGAPVPGRREILEFVRWARAFDELGPEVMIEFDRERDKRLFEIFDLFPDGAFAAGRTWDDALESMDPETRAQLESKLQGRSLRDALDLGWSEDSTD